MNDVYVLALGDPLSLHWATTLALLAFAPFNFASFVYGSSDSIVWVLYRGSGVRQRKAVQDVLSNLMFNSFRYVEDFRRLILCLERFCSRAWQLLRNVAFTKTYQRISYAKWTVGPVW